MKTVCLALCLLSGVTPLAAMPAKREISDGQAKALIIASLSSKQRKLPKLEVDSDTNSTSDKFLFYTVIWGGLQIGSVIVGNYAVDRFTGDVFSSTQECDEIRNVELLRAQKKFRSSIHLTIANYRRIKSRGPLCEVN